MRHTDRASANETAPVVCGAWRAAHELQFNENDSDGYSSSTSADCYSFTLKC